MVTDSGLLPFSLVDRLDSACTGVGVVRTLGGNVDTGCLAFVLVEAWMAAGW